MNLFTRNDLFLVLTHKRGHECQRTTNILEALSLDYHIVEDDAPANPHWHGITESVPAGAWAHAMDIIKQLSEFPAEFPDRVWFIEDDVHLHVKEFSELIEWTRFNVPGCLCVPKRFDRGTEPDWHWFRDNGQLTGTYNQLACVPATIILEALTRPTRFHELWFAGIAEDLGIQIVDWRQARQTSHLFGPWQWRPTVEAGPGLRHPVKTVAP